MRLLDTETQELNFFAESGRARYAILSHTWEDDEILFADIINRDRDWRQKPGADKVLGSCQLAREQGYKYIWIDTCCIDKSSSAELSEAINSMFDWYMHAEVCYVYLTDVAEDGAIAECRWFKRGWTLQELIAPTSLDFYDRQWRFINDKVSLSSDLARITGIDELLLRCGHSLYPPLIKDHHVQEAPEKQSASKRCSCGRRSTVERLDQIKDFCVAEKMSWASTRETTRSEDIAYCLMGLFNINMPLLYGEGSRKAFFRLQREIIETTHDQSILAFNSVHTGIYDLEPALASHPNQFADSGIVHFKPYAAFRKHETESTNFSMTIELARDGVTVELLVVPDVSDPAIVYGILDFQTGKHPLGRLAIRLFGDMTSADAPEFCSRGKGLFEISPAHPNYIRDFMVLTGRSDLKTLPDREISTQAVKRRRIRIIKNYRDYPQRKYRKGLPAPIHCIGSISLDCAPYSVEAHILGYAILSKPEHPRLLIAYSWFPVLDEWSPRIVLLKEIRFRDGLVPEDIGDAGQILAKFQKDYGYLDDHGDLAFTSPGRSPPGSTTLIVHGSSRLRVEVTVRRTEFLDWTIPDVTVHTTEMNPLKKRD